jgi:hypothetical protein
MKIIDPGVRRREVRHRRAALHARNLARAVSGERLMPLFKKKPITVQAVRVADIVSAATNSWKDLPKWVEDSYNKGGLIFLPQGIDVLTKEGQMRGNLDDWLIQGVAGELYPCKPDIFDKLYDPA